MPLYSSFDLTNPLSLSDKDFQNSIRMVFQQFLNCFYRNPEVWIAFSEFEQNIYSDNSNNAKSILKQGIVACPKNILLNIKLAELEELDNKLEDAASIYRLVYESNPSGYTFGLYQKFIRRHFGILAARSLFSETSQQRLHCPEKALEVTKLFS